MSGSVRYTRLNDVWDPPPTPTPPPSDIYGGLAPALGRQTGQSELGPFRTRSIPTVGQVTTDEVYALTNALREAREREMMMWNYMALLNQSQIPPPQPTPSTPPPTTTPSAISVHKLWLLLPLIIVLILFAVWVVVKMERMEARINNHTGTAPMPVFYTMPG